VQDILQRDAGIEARYSFHSLRHFAASIFIEQGATVKRVQEIMGHSTSQITLDIYSHLFTSHDDDQKMLAAAEAAVFPAGHNTG
jgi:site-specific recombinase XerD